MTPFASLPARTNKSARSPRRNRVSLGSIALLTVGWVTLASVTQAAAPTALTRVEVQEAQHSTAVQLFFDGPTPEVSSYVVEDPPRLVVDIPGAVDRTDTPSIRVDGLRVDQIEVFQPRAGRLEIVIDAAHIVDPFQGRGISPIEGGLLVTVGTGPVVAREGAPPAPVAAAGPVAPAPVAAEPPTSEGPQPIRSDGLRFRVTGFELVYAHEHVELPPVSELEKIDVELGVTSSGYVAPREGVPTETIRLLDVHNAPQQYFYGSAIRTINEHLVAELNRRGLAGVLVLPHEEDIEPRSSRDLRPDNRTTLRLVIWTGRLLEFRTFASGDRVPEDARVDNPVHERIKQHSPVQPGDLLRKRELDDYVARLNRHPGRNVDTALSAAQEAGGVYLDYLIAESRPLRAYIQGSNTGTKSTNDWRQRFGFVDTQLTNRDDILRFDYITGDFDKLNAVFGNYEAPVWKWDRWRASLGGGWSKYDASELGFVLSKFDGEQWDIGAQTSYNFFQYEDLFVDFFTGARFQRVDVKNKPIPGNPPSKGNSDFFLPEAGLRMERVDEFSTIRAALYGRFNIASIAGTTKSDVNSLGRNFVYNKNFQIMYWDVFASVFLEPFLNPSGYDDPSTPFTSTLAHEIQVSTRGQTAFDNRLAPQFEGILGGLRTVRGYNQSIVAGDTAITARVEYRFHLPRVLGIRPAPEKVPVVGDFRLTRQQVYGLPDWDLILLAFFDYGRTIQSGNVVGESNDTLMGAGPGIELRLFDNLVVSFAYGVALHDVRGGLIAKDGSHEFHFSGSLIY